MNRNTRIHMEIAAIATVYLLVGTAGVLFLDYLIRKVFS